MIIVIGHEWRALSLTTDVWCSRTPLYAAVDTGVTPKLLHVVGEKVLPVTSGCMIQRHTRR